MKHCGNIRVVFEYKLYANNGLPVYGMKCLQNLENYDVCVNFCAEKNPQNGILVMRPFH